MVDEEFVETVETALKDPSVVLFVTQSEKYHENSLKLLKYLTDKGLYGVYVTVNKPFATMKNEFKERGIDVSKVFFIDAISREIGTAKEDESQTMFLDSPENLTDISIVISEAMDSIKSEEKFLFLDSLSTLTIYNDANTVSKFAHHISNKLRKWDISGVFLSVEKEIDEKVLSTLSQFCDHTITL